MIIRPALSREYVSLPNSLFSDRRISIDTRGMLAFIMSKPRTWHIRPVPLMKALSKEGSTLGRHKLDRMLREAIEAGYIARSEQQSHEEDGTWGKYSYIVGLPDDVAAELESLDVASLPHMGEPHTGEPHTGEPHTDNPNTIHKEQSLLKTESINPFPKPSPANGHHSKRVIREDGVASSDAPSAGLSRFGQEARLAGQTPVWVGSKPYNAWLAHRGLDGMPPIVREVFDGKPRDCCWLPSRFPPVREYVDD